MMETLAIVFIGLGAVLATYEIEMHHRRMTAMEAQIAALQRTLDAQEQVIVVESPHPEDDGRVTT